MSSNDPDIKFSFVDAAYLCCLIFWGEILYTLSPIKNRPNSIYTWLATYKTRKGFLRKNIVAV